MIENAISKELKQIEAVSVAIKDNDIDCLKSLLSKNPKIAVANPFLLEKACELGSLETLKILLSFGSDPTSGGFESIKIASRLGRLDIVKLLFIEGYLDDDEYGFACQQAIINNRSDIVKFFLDSGVPSYFDNYSLVRLASTLGDLNIIKILGDNDAVFWVNGYSILQHAYEVNDFEIVKYFFDNKKCPIQKFKDFEHLSPTISAMIEEYKTAKKESELLKEDIKNTPLIKGKYSFL